MPWEDCGRKRAHRLHGLLCEASNSRRFISQEAGSPDSEGNLFKDGVWCGRWLRVKAAQPRACTLTSFPPPSSQMTTSFCGSSSAGRPRPGTCPPAGRTAGSLPRMRPGWWTAVPSARACLFTKNSVSSVGTLFRTVQVIYFFFVIQRIHPLGGNLSLLCKLYNLLA